MINITYIRQAYNNYCHETRKRLALPSTSWQLCLLSIIGGILAASLIVIFIWSLRTLQSFYLANFDNYTSLSAVSRFFLPFAGVLVIFAMARLTGYQYFRAGVPFVLHRLKVAYGVIPFRNTLNQFIGGVVSLASGFSVGKEGPAVHLGAACSAFVGHKFDLPLNSIRTLCACGIAAAIAACFNTPIAAVIFVMEVILREYKIHMFIPIMLSAIVGSVITSTIYGPIHEFEFFKQVSIATTHYPSLIVLGAVLGAIAYVFNRYVGIIIKHSQHIHLFKRLMAAAFVTSLVGLIVPHAMGTGLSAISFSLLDDWPFAVLATLLIAKMLLTTSAIGLGIPGGIIGPIIGIGAVAGACTASIASQFISSEHLTSDFALMGMAGFLAATLNAPLAALLAVVELSHQIDIMVPAMLVISAACLSSGQVFGNRSVFVVQLDMQKLIYRKAPIDKTLQNFGVFGLMKTNFCIYTKTELPNIVSNEVMVLSKETKGNHHDYYWHEPMNATNERDDFFDPVQDNNEGLTQTNIVRRHKLIGLPRDQTLAEAYWALKEKREGAIYIYNRNKDDIVGIITFEQIRKYLTEGSLS